MSSATEEQNVVRREIENTVKKIRASSQETLAPRISGCCYITKNTVRTCFNDFDQDMCSKAAADCGGFPEFVPGGQCTNSD